MTRRRLVLASTSPFRRELLGRLGIPFETADPRVDETPLPRETPEDTALRLSEAKARAVAPLFPDALIVGSDQVAILDGRVYGKPGTHENAVGQLRAMRGRTVNFFTGLCLLDARAGRARVRGVPTLVTFRDLGDGEIEDYLRREQPYGCAGAAKSEGLGIALIARLRGDDPNALIGLPLIALCDLLKEAGCPALRDVHGVRGEKQNALATEGAENTETRQKIF
ncbi:MAG: Maf family nucleotide pyrophosphatase [Candidatus Accumulibacter sp.]|nr:Maf family nucleotide pyrophosphatase [Accumulibacter sp.]